MARTAQKAKRTKAATKVCTRCKKAFPLSEFYRDKSTKDGHSPWHKGCEAAYAKEYAARKKEEGERKVVAKAANPKRAAKATASRKRNTRKRAKTA